MPSVFISHSSQDKKFVTALVTALNERQIQTWVDDKQIKVGQPIPRRISEGIASSDYFLIVISAAAVQSRWVENELNSAYFRAAQKRSDIILPVLLERISLPPLLESLKYADFSDSFEIGLNELLRSLEIEEAEIPFLSPRERRAKIGVMLSMIGRYGGFPTEILSLVEDESYLSLFESNLNLASNRLVLINSLYALEYLADGSDGRRICQHTSIPCLLSIYNEAKDANDVAIMVRVAGVLTAINSRATYDFLLDRVKEANPAIVATILANWQDMHEWGIEATWLSRLARALYELIRLPQSECLYFDYEQNEQDVRYWAFRWLHGFRRKDSVQPIEGFIAVTSWPVDALVEAAMAHWRATGNTKYIYILNRAARRRIDTSNAKYFLGKIREHQEKKTRSTRKR